MPEGVVESQSGQHIRPLVSREEAMPGLKRDQFSKKRLKYSQSPQTGVLTDLRTAGHGVVVPEEPAPGLLPQPPPPPLPEQPLLLRLLTVHLGKVYMQVAPPGHMIKRPG